MDVQVSTIIINLLDINELIKIYCYLSDIWSKLLLVKSKTLYNQIKKESKSFIFLAITTVYTQILNQYHNVCVIFFLTT